jgi:diguanylate cyclase (GGDEF)-like protein/PAS domain S-box-containing protein
MRAPRRHILLADRLEGLPWLVALSVPLLLALVVGAPAPAAGLLTLLANAALAMLGLCTFALGWLGAGVGGRLLGATLLAGVSLPMGLLSLCGFAVYGTATPGLQQSLKGAGNWYWWFAHAALPLALASAALPSARTTAPRPLRLNIFWAAWALSMALVAGLALLPARAQALQPQTGWIVLLNAAALVVYLVCRRRRGHGPALGIAAALATLSELCEASGRLQLAAPLYLVLALCMVLLLAQPGGFRKPWTALIRTRRDLLARHVARDTVLGCMSEAMLAVDAQRRVCLANEGACRLLGVDAAEVLGVDARGLLRRAWGDAGDVLLQDMEQALRSGTASAVEESTLRPSGGEGALVLERCVVPGRDADGAIVATVLLLRDVSERSQLQERLRDADDYVRALLDSSLYPMLLVDPRGVVVDLNPAAARLAGRDRADLLGREAAIVFCEAESVRVALRDALDGGWVRGLMQHMETDAGPPVEVLCNIAPCRSMLGEVKGAFVVMRDAGGPAPGSSAELRAGADALATLPNRRPFRDRVEEAVFRSHRTGQTGAVLFIDLDNFKDVNDALGHAAGDELLRVVGGRLSACLRGTDVVARIGGDEFAMLAENLCGPEDARLLAERLLLAVRESVTLGGVELVVSCSIGVSIFPLDMGGADTLLRNADTAMFRAKEAGKNNCQFFTDDMSRRVRRRVEINTQLRTAIRESELSVVYQPRIAVEGQHLAGVEALLRWHNAELGQVGPQEFIPVAEESGLIAPIGEWVLRQACDQAARWRETAGREVSVAVNISARQFRDTDIVRTVVDALGETGLPSRLLELELTESVLMRDSAKAVETLQRLNAIGVRVALDDFGTGYSSLSYLKRFPLDCLKIDRSFIADVTGDVQAEAIVRTIIALGHGLGMRVVAEGVETQEQLDMLRRLRCDEVQGYLLGRPAPPDQLIQQMREMQQMAAVPAATRPSLERLLP